jgi:outer membrane lipoprotein-sorting protein
MMKKRVLWALLTLVILLSACGQIEKNVPDVPSSPQEVVEDAPSFISNEITTSETDIRVIEIE